MNPNLLFNGRAPDDAAALASSRGLHYGDGVFRTLLVWDGTCLDWPQQLEKLAADARALELAMPDQAVLTAEAGTLAAGQSRAVLKILLWRRTQGRGYAPGTDQAERLLQLSPAPAYPASCWQQGIRATLARTPLSIQAHLAGIKHLNRLDQVLASRDCRDGALEALMCDDRQQLICGSRSNLFWVRDGQVHSAALDRCGVSGMMRARVIAQCHALNLRFAEASLPLAEVATVEEAFVSNSLIGIWPLQALDQTSWRAPGPRTVQLMNALRHPRLESP
jgi:4-amino-4-deoxychorismate lyase